MKATKCFLFWYRPDFDSEKHFVYIFTNTEAHADRLFRFAFELQADTCEKGELFKEEKDFIISHTVGEIWGKLAII